MTGTAWHVEKMTRSYGDDRRHRSRCVYYQKEESYCTRRCLSCFGSAHCQLYKEEQADKQVIDEEIPFGIESKKQNPVDNGINPFPINSKIKHTVFGTGTVIGGHRENVMVLFDNGLIKQLNINVCLSQKLMTVLFFPSQYKNPSN